ncbi:oligosaccharide flippase family protein [Alkalicoccobacillus plakortidis]|uniref:Oligosaccharide flippase family protein n=1 Tax=Alkalicoccobacillus plakortidis TaxID=444060 RepID=A0ABT0XLM6_9BACI|nr:oligosaccharide flippase family protein [Alkalicoccobacillus plakortidis]MCM2676821.1 oligosaccharide flippase family protein [Alkalicoccobacillus plakortidis]
MNPFFRGALLLSTAALAGESLEFLINVVLANELGEHNFGLYMAILPTLVFVVVLSSLELQVSVSKMVAERENSEHISLLKAALKLAIIVATTCLTAAFFILPNLPVLDHYHPLVKWMLILLIPIVTFSSVARGYFVGAQHTKKIAVINLLKRGAQLTILYGVFKVFQFQSQTAIFVALGTVVLSEILVLFYMGTAFVIQINRLRKNEQKPIENKEIYQSLLAVSLPTTGLRVFHAITFAVKPFLITTALSKAGLMEGMALIQYGKLAGVAFTIGFFPAFIAHSLLTVMVPLVSSGYSKGDFHSLAKLLRQAMGVTFAYSLPVVMIFYFLAEPMTDLFFEHSPASGYLTLLVPYFLFHYFAIPMQAYLIGIGLVREAFMHSVWSTGVSFLLMFTLGSLPSLQMDGIIIGMNVGAVLLTLMHYLTITEKLGLTLVLTHSSKSRFK